MSDKNSNRPERLVAENISEVIWLRLRRFTSQQLCRRIIQKRTTGLTSQDIDRKANGMSWAIRSALGYWDTKSGGLNAKVLSRYYALLQISIAEQIGSNDSADDLPSIQRHTENGHGLFTLQNTGTDFPKDILIGCLKSGHFSVYCKKLGLDLTPFSFDQRPRTLSKISETEISKLISLYDLIRRVPELQTVIPEYFDDVPLSFQIAYASRNHSIRSERRNAHVQKTGNFLFEPPEGDTVKTFVEIHPHGSAISADDLNQFGFPIKNIVKGEPDPLHVEDYYIGEIEHAPPSHTWWDYVDTHKSGYCGTSIVVPFWKTGDPFLLHLVILYALSIIVRYLPERWHDIEDGKFDHFRALLEHYMVIVDNVLPRIAIERLTGTKLLATQSGSLHAPI